METFGQRLKKLRTTTSITLTQEKLAEQLGITSQAVSRWETDAAMPDIDFLVPLAHMFGVSTDYLLGCNNSTRDEQIDAILKDIENNITLLNENDPERLLDEIATLRQALARYPGDYKLSYNLALTLHSYSWNGGEGEAWEANRNRNIKEALELCRYVADNCNDPQTRCDAITEQCALAGELNDEAMLTSFAAALPSLYNARETTLMTFSTAPHTRAQNARDTLSRFNLYLGHILYYIALDTDEDGKERYTAEQRIEILQKAEKFYTALDEKNEMRVVGNEAVNNIRSRIAYWLFELGRGDEADRVFTEMVDDALWSYEHPDWQPERSVLGYHKDVVYSPQYRKEFTLASALASYERTYKPMLERPACRAAYDRLEKALRAENMI